jgi:hypothetical protein
MVVAKILISAHIDRRLGPMAANRDWVFTLDKKKLQFLAKLAWAWYIVFQKGRMSGPLFPFSGQASASNKAE